MYLYLLNEELSKDNALSLVQRGAGCCNADPKVCNYKLNFGSNALNTISALTIKKKNGTTTTIPVISSPRATNGEVLEAVDAAIRSNSMIDTEDYSGIKIVGSTLELVSEAEIISFVADGNTINAVAECSKTAICTISGAVAVDTDFGKLGTTSTNVVQVGTPSGYATGQAATLKTDIETVLTGLSVNYTSVVVTENTALSSYSYSIVTVGKVPLYVNGEMLTNCNCKPGWKV